MADTFVKLEDGKLKSLQGTDASAGAANAGDIVSLGSNGLLDPSLLPTGVGADIKMLEATEALSAGDYVNIFDDGGTQKVRLADNSNGRDASGFVLSSYAANATASVYTSGDNNALTGLSIGTRQYLGTLGGTIETPLDPTVPGNVGKIHQYLGKSVDATCIAATKDDCILIG